MLPPDPSDDLQSYFQMCDSVTGLGMAPPDSLYGLEDPFFSLNMSPFDELTGNQQQQQQQPSTLPSKASTSAGAPLESTLPMPSGLHAHQQKPLMVGRPPDSTMPYGDFPLLGIQPSTIQPDMLKAPLRQTDRASPSSPTRPTAGDQRRKASDAASQGSPEKSIFGSDSPAISHGTPSSTMSIDLPRRDAHMASEQRRRAIMGQCFERLKQLLPPQEYRKPSKANILQAVVNYLETLQRLERTLRHRIQSLQQENAVLKQHVHGGGTSFGMGGASLGTHSRASTLDTNHPPIAPK